MFPKTTLSVLAVCGVLWICSGEAGAQAQRRRVARGRAGAAEAQDLYAAQRLLKKAADLLSMGEKDRAVKMLETIIQQYPDTTVRYEAYLALGKHFLDQRDQRRGVAILRHVKELKKPDADVTGKAREIYLEGLYLMGTAYFRMKQYGAAFPLLRQITANYPNTVWANQAYYYVGMCHFAQGNWNKAIKALGLVGTFVDPDSPTVEYVEAGRRFYVKIEDGDLPVLYRLGREVSLTVESASGDKVTSPCVPLSLKQGVFLCSVPTAVGPPKSDDGILQVVGGDKITTRYTDNNTKEGEKDVRRHKEVQVVSTGMLSFTMGTYEAKAPAAFIGQPLHVMLLDVDQDTTKGADSVLVKIVSRYKAEAEEEESTGELTGELTFREEQKYKNRDEVTVKLAELGKAPVHSGRFVSSVKLEGFRENQPVNRNDDVLTCALNDEVVATYVDELHIGGTASRQAQAKVRVAGEIASRLGTSVNFVPDPILKAKKNLVEGTAYLELARIFRSMGLKKGAKVKADEGLERVDTIIRMESPIPSSLKEEAFKLRWELFLVQDDFAQAIATCRLFNRLYPDSPFVDEALMGIGKIHFESKDYRQATNVFRQILRLPNSMAKAEAQYMIARAVEIRAEEAAAKKAKKATEAAEPLTGLNESAIREYKLCAERYPDSQYAGASLGKLVDYYLMTRDYPRANDLLEQIFEDYRDQDFLDNMLLKWVLVAYRMGNYKRAHDKCSQLIFEYPASPHAKKAKELLPAIDAELKRSKEAPAAKSAKG